MERISGAKITFEAKWRGIQDGLTFKIRDVDFAAVKKAENLLSQLLKSVSFFWKIQNKIRKLIADFMNCLIDLRFLE